LSLGKLEAAKKDLDELCTKDPKDLDSRVQRAIVFLKLGKSKEAIEEASEAIQLDPKSGKPYFPIAYAQFLQGNKKAAIDSLTKAISLDAKDAPSYYFRGNIQVDDDPPAALQDLNKALEISPYTGQAGAFSLKGKCLLSLNRPKEALSCFL